MPDAARAACVAEPLGASLLRSDLPSGSALADGAEPRTKAETFGFRRCEQLAVIEAAHTDPYTD